MVLTRRKGEGMPAGGSKDLDAKNKGLMHALGSNRDKDRQTEKDRHTDSQTERQRLTYRQIER